MSKVKSSLNKELETELIRISKKYDLDLLVLFGSRARGDFTKESDWDFAFFRKKRLTNDEVNNLYADFVNLLNDDNLDLIEISEEISVALKWEIFKDGILIYEKDKNLFFKFYDEAFFDFVDFKEYLDMREKIIQNEFEKIDTINYKKTLNL